MIGAGFPDANCSKYETGCWTTISLVATSLTLIFITVRIRAHRALSENLDPAKGRNWELMPSVIASGLGVDMTTMMFDASPAIPVLCLAR
jgi:hypothetical protein